MSPADILRAFALAAGAAGRAEATFTAYHASLSADDLEFPTATMTDRLDRLEERYSRLIGPLIDAEELAIEAMKSVGADVNAGGVRVDGRLFTIVHDEHAPEPTIIIIDLADVHDLD